MFKTNEIKLKNKAPLVCSPSKPSILSSLLAAYWPVDQDLPENCWPQLLNSTKKYSQIGCHPVNRETTEKTWFILLLLFKSKSFMCLKFPIKVAFYSLLIVSFAPGSLPSLPCCPFQFWPTLVSWHCSDICLAEHKTTNMFNLSGFLQCYSIKLAISERI